VKHHLAKVEDSLSANERKLESDAAALTTSETATKNGDRVSMLKGDIIGTIKSIKKVVVMEQQLRTWTGSLVLMKLPKGLVDQQTVTIE
jgi:hypothetical protein